MTSCWSPTRTGGANKLDAFLERRIHYDATVAESGAVDATMPVELVNSVPETGLSEYQTGDERPDPPTRCPTTPCA